MRSSSFSYTSYGQVKTGIIEYPELWCLAFNPNYAVIHMDDTTDNRELKITLASSSKSYNLYVNLYKGEAKVFISRVLQLLIDDIEHHRSVTVQLDLYDGEFLIIPNISFIVVWGSLPIGEQFGRYGAFELTGKDSSHIRNVIWFKNFPFYVSMFRTEGTEYMSGKYDDNALNDSLRLFRPRIDALITGELPAFDTEDIVPLQNLSVCLNTTHGIIYAYDEDYGYCRAWTSAVSTYGSSDYYNINGHARDDIEFEYHGDIVRWNSDSKQVERATMGNADTTGIFELCPALTFPKAIRTAQYYISLEKVSTAVFNMNFNFPFPDTSKIINEIVNLRISNEQNGLYLRWIDGFGLIQYYLFVQGENTHKTKASTDVVYVERSYNGICFGSLARPIEVSNTISMKCSAVNLPKDILGYVKTIVHSAVVELYMGKNRSGTELWQPINIADGSYKTDPDTEISEFEITIELPEGNSQSL